MPAARHCGRRGSREFFHCCWLLLQAAEVRIAGCWPEAGLAWSPCVLPQCPQTAWQHGHRMCSKVLNHPAALWVKSIRQCPNYWSIFWKCCGFLALEASGFARFPVQFLWYLAPTALLALTACCSPAGPGMFLTQHVRTPQDSQQLCRPRIWWGSCTCSTVSFSMAPSQTQTPAPRTATLPAQSRLPSRVYVSSIVLLFLTCLPSR